MKKIDVRNTQAFQRRIDNFELYRKSYEFQDFLAENGVAWHNNFANECTLDLSCCVGDGKYTSYLPSYYSFAKTIFEELFEQIKHGDQDHQDWLKNKMNEFLDELYQTL